MKRVVIAVVLGAALAAVAYNFVRDYGEAVGEARRLREERATLQAALATVVLQRDSARAVHDTVGTGAAAANAAALQHVATSGTVADTVRVTIVQQASPDLAAQVLRLDSIRVAQLDTMHAVHVRDSTTIVQLTGMLHDERALHDGAMANVQRQMRNLELQVSAFQRVAQRSWLDRHAGTVKAVAAGVAAGVGACAQWPQHVPLC